MAIKYLSDQGPDGTVLGNDATDLVGFYGATPVAQVALVTNTSGTVGNTNDAVDAIIAALQTLGLMASS